MDLLIVITLGTLGVNWHIQSDVNLLALCRQALSRIQATVVALNEWRLAHASDRKNS